MKSRRKKCKKLKKKYTGSLKCNKCEFIFVNPRPEAEKINRYYNSPEYISHSGSEKGIVNKIYKKIIQIYMPP